MNRTDDTTAVNALLDQLADTWARGDGTAYGSNFTDDASYVTYVGTLYQGGPEIGRAHQVLFDSFLKGTKLAIEFVAIRFHGPDSAVVITRGDTYKKKPGKPRKLQIYAVVRQTDGQWRIAAFQNTMRRPLMEAISFKLKPVTQPAVD